MLKVVYCKISSWKGSVPWAEHYYVDLRQRVCPRKPEKVWHNLTLSEAERLNRRNPDERWEAGEEVGYFFSLERARQGAIDQYKTIFPGAIILVEGSIGTYEPQPILDGPLEAMEALNNLVVRSEEIVWWEGDEKAMQEIADEWEDIWIPEFEKE